MPSALRGRWWPSAWGWIGWGSLPIVGIASAFLYTRSADLRLPLPSIEVNTADSLTLLSVPGLSPGRVQRLLEGRRQLRGFWEIEEVEVTLDSSAWRIAGPFLTVRHSVAPESLPVLNLNAIDSATLVEKGLCRPKAARSLVRYRYKRGGFTRWEDLDSLYTLLPVERYRLRRYGVLAPTQASHPPKSPRPTHKVLNINQASAEELEKLPGIGLKTAERIVKYREKLRYFVSLSQLREVWGLRPENLEKALPYLEIGPPAMGPLSLRYASVEELAAHPYISWKLARYLVRQRTLWGDRPIPADVWHTWLPDTLLPKLTPYLTGD